MSKLEIILIIYIVISQIMLATVIAIPRQKLKILKIIFGVLSYPFGVIALFFIDGCETIIKNRQRKKGEKQCGSNL